MRVLVVYASADGSTAEIAARIAGRLGAADHQVTVAEARAVEGLGGWDAVVLGSAVHNRQWLDDAVMFVHTHRPALARLPVWVWSVGMPDALPGFLRRLARTEEAAVLDHLDGLEVEGHRLFSGVVEPSQFPLASRVFLRLVGGRYGDFRDWPAIEAWADGIASALAGRDGDGAGTGTGQSQPGQPGQPSR